jgi:hypothetical protein
MAHCYPVGIFYFRLQLRRQQRVLIAWFPGDWSYQEGDLFGVAIDLG